MAQFTPLDVINKQFGPARGRGGYEPDEVHAFLDEVREAWESSIREGARLRDELAAREDTIAELRAEQGEIKETLVLARRLALDLENTARREVDVTLGEARLEAQSVLAAAHDERRALHEEVLRLRSARSHIVAQMRALIEAHGRMLDELDAQE